MIRRVLGLDLMRNPPTLRCGPGTRHLVYCGNYRQLFSSLQCKGKYLQL